MKTFLLGLALGISLMGAGSWAFDARGETDRIQAEQERFNASVERQRQEQFRLQQRQPC